MATITITLSDTGEDIALKIVSKDPELPLRSDIRSSDPDLTPAQAMAFEMIELYVKANHVEEGDESAQEKVLRRRLPPKERPRWGRRGCRKLTRRRREGPYDPSRLLLLRNRALVWHVVA
jgi:hypothetical protein